jgi:hypothetical protein
VGLRCLEHPRSDQLKVVLVSVPNCPRGLPSSCEIARCQLLVYPHVGLHGANVGQPYMLCNRISECQVPQLPTRLQATKLVSGG